MPEHDRSQYPYACLNMAVLQADFGSFEEALPAINEAISAAREAKDYNCLAFCLIWLYHFNLHHSTESTRKLTTNMLGSDDAGLAYLRQQAKEHKLHNLESSILLSQTNAITSKVKLLSVPLAKLRHSREQVRFKLSRGCTNRPRLSYNMTYQTWQAGLCF